MSHRILSSLFIVLFLSPIWAFGQIPVDDPELPPKSECSFRNRVSKAMDNLEYNDFMGLIILADGVHRCFSPVIHTDVGPDEVQTFDSIFETNVSMFGNPFVETTLSGPVQSIAFLKAGVTTGSFDTEIISMDLIGDVTGFGQIIVREDPSLSSTGHVLITDIGSGLYAIDSFFDVFTEVSYDGGASWISQSNGPTTLRYTIYAPSVEVTNPDLPAQSQCEFMHRYYQGHSPIDYNPPGVFIVLSDPNFFCWTNVFRQDIGADELESFDAVLRVDVSVNGNPGRASMFYGHIQTITLNKVGNTTGLFETELIDMTLIGDVSGYGQFLIREDPTLISLGETTIVDLGGGIWSIHSFFDVFTELSMDGGASWEPQLIVPTRMYYTISADIRAYKADADSDGIDDVLIEWNSVPGLPNFDVFFGLNPDQIDTLLTGGVTPAPAPPEYQSFHIDALLDTNTYFYNVVPLYPSP